MIEFALAIFIRVTINSEVERLQEASHISGNKDYLDVACFVLAQNFVCYLSFEDIKNYKSFLIRLNQSLSLLGDIRQYDFVD